MCLADAPMISGIRFTPTGALVDGHVKGTGVEDALTYLNACGP